MNSSPTQKKRRRKKKKDPKMFDGLLACDEADAGEGRY